MYGHIYNFRKNKYNFDENNYISNIRQKNNPPNKQYTGAYINKRPNSTKYANLPQQKLNYINYDIPNNISSNPRRINSSM